MGDHIVHISSDIEKKIEGLVSAVEKKYKDKFFFPDPSPTNPDSIPYTRAVDNFIESVNLMKMVSPFHTIKSAAFINRTLLLPKPLDLRELNTLKPKLLIQLFPNPSTMQPEDFAESRREEYEWAYKIRILFYLFDTTLLTFSSFSLSNWLAPFPKSAIEEAWDALEHTVNEFNNTLKTIEDTQTIKDNQINNSDEKNTTRLSRLNSDTISLILSYIDPIEFTKIVLHPMLHRLFRTRESVVPTIRQMQQDGFNESTFFYFKVNPLAIALNKNLYNALKQLLQEGFHPALFKTIDPQRLLQAPRIENIQEPLTSTAFPDTHRVVRGTFSGNSPFICIMNSKNIPVTFYQYSPGNKSIWEHYTDSGYSIDEAELKIAVTNNTVNFECKASVIEKNYSFGGLKGQNIHPSFQKWQAWLALFLGYINESCPQKNGGTCEPAILDALTQQLTDIITDRFPCVDRTQYPDVELPHNRPVVG